jgi:hypothetical protein
VNKAYLVYFNNGYVREGDIVPNELFVIQENTGVVREKQASIPDTLVGCVGEKNHRFRHRRTDPPIGKFSALPIVKIEGSNQVEAGGS